MTRSILISVSIHLLFFWLVSYQTTKVKPDSVSTPFFLVVAESQSNKPLPALSAALVEGTQSAIPNLTAEISTPESTAQSNLAIDSQPPALGAISESQRFAFGDLGKQGSEDMAVGPFGGVINRSRGITTSGPTESIERSASIANMATMQMQISQRRSLFEQTIQQRAHVFAQEGLPYKCIARLDAQALLANLVCSPPEISSQEIPYFSKATRFSSDTISVDKCYAYGIGESLKCN